MSQPVVYTLIGLCLVVIALCLSYLYRYWQQRKQKQKAEVERIEKQANDLRERRAYLIESVQVIARAVGHDEKLTLTEASIRLSTLLESLSPELVKKPEVSVLREMHNLTQHIPIKDKWQQLSKQERWRYKLEMAELEKKHEAKIHQAASFLVEYDFSKLIH